MLDSRIPAGLLRIPEQQDLAHRSLDARPQSVERWVNALPRADIGETARLVFKSLHEFNRTRLIDTDRLRIMELFREPVHYLTQTLNKHFIGLPMPLPRKKQKIALLVRELQSEMAIGYKIIIESKLSGAIARNDHAALTQVIQRALRYLGLALVKSYQIYIPPPKNIWKEIHGLFMYAHDTGLLDTNVTDRVTERIDDCSITGLYKQIALLSLAGPYRLRQSEIDTLYAVLSEWSQLVELADIVDPDQQTGMCSLNLHSDEPPGYLTLCGNAEVSHCRVLDTARLVDVVSGHVAQGHEVLAPGTLVRTNKLGLELLRRLLLAWTGMAKRTFSRSSRSSKVQVTIGINATHYFIHDALGTQNVDRIDNVDRPTPPPAVSSLSLEPLETASGGAFAPRAPKTTKTPFNSKTAVDAQRIFRGPDVWSPTFNAAKPNTGNGEDQEPSGSTTDQPAKAPYEFHTCKSLNESAGGFCLLWMPVEATQTPINALVGELIGMQEINEQNKSRWSIGVIRWMKSPDGKQLELGVQKLAPFAMAALVRSERGKIQTEFLRGLILPEIKAVNLPVTLVTPNVFDMNAMLTLQTNGENKSVRLTKQLESTGGFAHFEFQDWKKHTPRSRTDQENDDSRWNFDNLWSSL